MNLKLNYIYIILFASFFFFWGVNLNFIRDLEFLDFDSKSRDFLSNFKLSYLIVILIIPILYKFIKEKSLSPNIIFINWGISLILVRLRKFPNGNILGSFFTVISPVPMFGLSFNIVENLIILNFLPCLPILGWR